MNKEATVQKKGSRRGFYALCGLIFAAVFVMNLLTPYVADDFYFSFGFDTGRRLTGLGDLVRSLAYHYYEWSGRIIVKFFAQAFTMLPKVVFDVCNAAMYLGLGLVIYRLGMGRRRGRYDVVGLLLIEAALWEISPVWGQTNLWMCGACNYLWATMGCLAYLLPWRYYLQKPFTAPKWMPAAMLFGGILAGWMNENTSAGLLAMLVCVQLAVWLQQKKLPLWMPLGFLGTLAGYFIMIIARGNYNRASAYSDYDSLLTRYAVRFFNCLNMLKDYALPLLFGFALLYLLLWWQQNGKNTKNVLVWPVVLLVGGLAANFAMLLSSAYYERSTHGVFSLLTAACAACLLQIDGKNLRKAFAAGAACAAILCTFHLLEAGYDIASFCVMTKVRNEDIRAQLAAAEVPGQTTVHTYGVECYTRWCAGYGLPDVRESGEDSIGIGRTLWFGAGDIVADETRSYPFPGHTNAAYEAYLPENAQNP